jgi:hypothetical protein
MLDKAIQRRAYPQYLLYKYYLYNHPRITRNSLRQEFFRSRLVAMDDIFFQEDLDPAIRTLNQQAGTDGSLTIDKRIKRLATGFPRNEKSTERRPNDEPATPHQEHNSSGPVEFTAEGCRGQLAALA